MLYSTFGTQVLASPLYTRSIVMDGNFTAYHIKQARMTHDVSLTVGEGYMTEPVKYKNYVKDTTEIREAWLFFPRLWGRLTKEQQRTCHEHRADIDKNLIHAGCDITGIGASACARHGAFCPSSVVDFQKGER